MLALEQATSATRAEAPSTLMSILDRLLSELTPKGIGKLDNGSLERVTLGTAAQQRHPGSLEELVYALGQLRKGMLTLTTESGETASLTVEPGRRLPITSMQASCSSVLLSVVDAWEACRWDAA
ncbi:hypothetical protein FIU88_18165 (plasmid) [Halomonas sp. THAF12]|uniref:hypothetical protein n=1 Tax=Halomonas sp. THAF12 TaxID=2587849 RepID=UPI001268B9A7|nr:hypothetical protein [Halomonas sp. THAF12]QFT86876.1 hypothetical protein FIU88_18165 [Halomonas sp. THAF12]